MNDRRALVFVRVRSRLERAAREGLLRSMASLLEWMASALVWILALPATILLHLSGYRRLTVHVARIGHLAAEPDTFLKARALGEVPPAKYFLAAPPAAVAPRRRA